VEATQYTDGTTTPIIMVQGLVTNMSRSSRHVPPLLAIVWDKDGRELKRWKFTVELPTLSPGRSTGFRSEAMAPDSNSAKVTVVLAPELLQASQ
jgi:hypothetical protein